MVGLVPEEALKPGDLVGVNKDSFLILESLPTDYDSRVKAMELDEKPSEDYNDIGGLDKQIEELVEAIVLPMTHPDRFKKLGIKPPKGIITFIRCADVWTTRNWKNVACESMCCSNQCSFFETCCSSISAGNFVSFLDVCR